MGTRQIRPIEAIMGTCKIRPIEAILGTRQIRPIEAIVGTRQICPIEAIVVTRQIRPIEAIRMSTSNTVQSRVFSPARSPPQTIIVLIPRNPTHLSTADPPRIRRGPRRFCGGILSTCISKWNGNRFLPV